MAQAAANVQSKAASSAGKLTTWRWTGKTRQGDARTGEMEAGDEAAVRARLAQMGIEPTRVRRRMADLHLTIPGMSGVSTKDILIFTRQFSVMIDAGLPLVQALDIIGTQADNLAFRKVLLAIKGKVESGSTFADALAEHPKAFDELFVQLVRAGEIGGILDTILNRLGAYIEKNEKLKRRVKGAMVYPSIVLGVAVLVTVVLLVFVTPTFEKMFKDFGGAMPAPTQFIIDLSNWLQSYILHLIGGIVAVVFAFRAFLASKKGRDLWVAFVLNVLRLRLFT